MPRLQVFYIDENQKLQGLAMMTTVFFSSELSPSARRSIHKHTNSESELEYYFERTDTKYKC